MLIILESKALETSLLSSPPKYNNQQLEQIIDRNRNESFISLCEKQLTDDDMEIVAYYLLLNNKVSDILFNCHYKETRIVLIYSIKFLDRFYK